MSDIIWASLQENLSSVVCEQQRHRPACAYAQTDQRFYYSLIGKCISLLSSSKISIFQLVCVDEEAGLKLALLETPKTGFLAKGPIY